MPPFFAAYLVNVGVYYLEHMLKENKSSTYFCQYDVDMVPSKTHPLSHMPLKELSAKDIHFSSAGIRELRKMGNEKLNKMRFDAPKHMSFWRQRRRFVAKKGWYYPLLDGAICMSLEHFKVSPPLNFSRICFCQLVPPTRYSE